LRQGPSVLDFFKDPLVNQIKELRHHGKSGDVAFAQSAQKLGRVQSFEIDHARALDQRKKQISHLCQHVKHGQHAQQCVLGADVDPVEHSFHFTQKIGVGKHDALGVGGGSGSVEQGSEVFRHRLRRLEFSRAAVENRRQVS
jgi:hypothetical protein